jgi:Tat protein translocase TatB subunit
MIGSFGGPELLLVLVLALILFGPRRLPQIGRMIGRAMSEFRGAAHEFRSSLEREVEIQEIRELRAEAEAAVRGRGELPAAAPDPARGEERDDGPERGVRPPGGS